jgi:hypothetical protein
MRVGRKVTGEWLEGGCHCQAVRFRVRSASNQVVSCNCSLCRKRADLQLIVASSDFEILSGEADLVLYQFNTGVARHRFCRVCGIHPFNTPRSNPDSVAVNVRCLDRSHPDCWSIAGFDGENWEKSIARLHAAQTASGNSR